MAGAIVLLLLAGLGAWLFGARETSETRKSVPVVPVTIAKPPVQMVVAPQVERKPKPKPVPAAAIALQRERVRAAEAAFDSAYADTQQAEIDLDYYRELDERRWISRYTLAEVEDAASETRERAVQARIRLDAEQAKLSTLTRSARQ